MRPWVLSSRRGRNWPDFRGRGYRLDAGSPAKDRPYSKVPNAGASSEPMLHVGFTQLRLAENSNNIVRLACLRGRSLRQYLLRRGSSLGTEVLSESGVSS